MYESTDDFNPSHGGSGGGAVATALYDYQAGIEFSTSKSYMPAVAIIHVVDILLGFSILSKLCKLSESSLLTATNFSAHFDMDWSFCINYKSEQACI